MKKTGKRNSLEIRVWMLKAGIKRIDIERALKVSGALVTRTIDGERNSKAVLDYLAGKGCPRKILDLPRRSKVCERRKGPA